jgi:hypothetical protein
MFSVLAAVVFEFLSIRVNVFGTIGDSIVTDGTFPKICASLNLARLPFRLR